MRYCTALRFSSDVASSGVASSKRAGFALRQLQQLAVADQVGHAQARHACLLGAKEFAGAAQFQIFFRNLKAVAGAHHRVQPLLGFFADPAAGHQHAVGFGGAASDASAQLMHLREPEAFRVFNDHDRSVGDIHAHLDDRGGNQNVQLAGLELAHDFVFFIGVHASVQQARASTPETLSCAARHTF